MVIKMKKKILIGAGAVLIVLLMVSSATAGNLTLNDNVFEESVDEKDTNIEEQRESGNNPKGEKAAGVIFPILIVKPYTVEPKVGRLSARVTVHVVNTNGPGHAYRRAIGFWSTRAIFFGFFDYLHYGRTYKIYCDPEYTGAVTEEITIQSFLTVIDICAGSYKS